MKPLFTIWVSMRDESPMLYTDEPLGKREAVLLATRLLSHWDEVIIRHQKLGD
jgi:hypothetical protein